MKQYTAGDAYYDKLQYEEQYKVVIAFCGICGAEYRDDEGECYTDCTHYQGDEDADYNPAPIEKF